MKILYGTTNQGKLDFMRQATEGLGIEIVGLNDLTLQPPKVDESGNDTLENAQIKAKAYYEAFSMPVFSCDSGLYFDGIEDSLQPGLHIRRVNGKELSDEEMTEYYASLAKDHGGHLIAQYRNAICLILSDTISFSSMDKSLGSEPFMIVSQPHEKRVKGFPLDCLSADIASGKYFFDIQEDPDYDPAEKSDMEQAFRDFFTKALSVASPD